MFQLGSINKFQWKSIQTYIIIFHMKRNSFKLAHQLILSLITSTIQIKLIWIKYLSLIIKFLSFPTFSHLYILGFPLSTTLSNKIQCGVIYVEPQILIHLAMNNNSKNSYRLKLLLGAVRVMVFVVSSIIKI